MRKSLFFLTFITILLASCSITKKNTYRYKTKIFSVAETEMILADSSNKPMRVYLINNQLDSVILRSKSKNFKIDPNDKVLNHFTKRLYQTVIDSASAGVGIAAPQVGILKKIIWVQRFDKKENPFEVYYNPTVKKYSELKQDVFEGCLSIPDVRDTTNYRSYAVLLEYDNIKGEHICEMIEAFTAVIFQHEIDHLNGILFTDHLEKEKNKSLKHKL